MHEATLSRRTMFKAAGVGAAAMLGTSYASAVVGGVPRKLDDAPKSNAGKQGAGFYRFNVGSIEGTVLTDGNFSIPDPHPTIAAEATKEELIKALADALQPTDRVSLEINPVLLKIGSERILVDTGTGPNGRMMDNLRASGTTPEQITAIIITHAHGDHISGTVGKDGALAFPNAKIFMGKAEHDFWTGPADMPNSRMPADNRKGMADGAKKSIAAIKSKLELVKPGDKLLSGLELIDSAGHTPGHLCISVDGGSEKLVMLADLVHNHVAMFHNPDWTIGFDSDPKAAAAARKRIFPMLVADKARVFAYHLPWPGFGGVGRHGDSYWWAQESWNWG